MQARKNFGWDRKFTLWCNPVESGPGFSPSGKALASVLWVHYISKAYEFVDTFIMVNIPVILLPTSHATSMPVHPSNAMLHHLQSSVCTSQVLKKNNRQVSFLHVYHHCTTFWPVSPQKIDFNFPTFLTCSKHLAMAENMHPAVRCGGPSSSMDLVERYASPQPKNL